MVWENLIGSKFHWPDKKKKGKKILFLFNSLLIYKKNYVKVMYNKHFSSDKHIQIQINLT